MPAIKSKQDDRQIFPETQDTQEAEVETQDTQEERDTKHEN